MTALLAGSVLALTACGGPPPPHPDSKHGPDAKSPTIALTMRNARGANIDLRVGCGGDTSLKECASVMRSLIDQAGQVKNRGSRSDTRTAP